MTSKSSVTVDVHGGPAVVNVESQGVSVTLSPLALGGGGQTQVLSEVPSGVKNGSNVVFTLTNAYLPNTTSVYRNGLIGMRGSDYNETGPREITFSDAPLSDDFITVSYTAG